ncbi:MAG: hypothetical protein PUP91_01330 [Rhizonema sp. PD37]|nr:hypothetical protein [Rhizonema sp. PD37]
MSSEKPNPPIDFSQAKEPPTSLDLNQPDTGGLDEEHTPDEEINENVGERQMNSAYIPAANIISDNQVNS